MEIKNLKLAAAAACLTGALALGVSGTAFAGKKAPEDTHSEKNACKGENGCKGENSCKGENGCKGENSCKGENGCKGENSCKGENGCNH